jgi:hypothetical protein
VIKNIILKIIEIKIITSGYKKKFIDKDYFAFELNKK